MGDQVPARQARSIRLAPGAAEPSDSRTIRLDPSAPRASAARPVADIVLAIDTTGSMSNKIQGLLASSARFAEHLASKDVKWRIAIVAFGDLRVEGDRIVATGYTNRVGQVRQWLNRIPRYSGGGNRGESSLDALDRALALDSRPEAVRVFVLITDEPPHQHGEMRVPAMVTRLRQQRVVTFTVAPDLPAYHQLAERTGGEWFLVRAGADFTSILEMFDRVVGSVAATVSAIALEAGGDVEQYLLQDGRKRGG